MAPKKPPDPKECVQWHVAMTMVYEQMAQYHRAQADHYFWMNERMLASRPKAAAKAKSKGIEVGAYDLISRNAMLEGLATVPEQVAAVRAALLRVPLSVPVGG